MTKIRGTLFHVVEESLLLNAVVHRDYTSPVDIQLKIFDNAITFFNPGKLFGDLTVEKLMSDDYQSRTRNKLVAEAFYLTRDIEKYESGFIRVMTNWRVIWFSIMER